MGFDLVQQSPHERLLEMMDDGAMILNDAGVILWANRAVARLLGISEDVRGTSLDRWFNAAVPFASLLHEHRTHNGRRHWLAVTANGAAEMELSAHLCPGSGECVLVIRPHDKTMASFERVISFATRDAVTQLLNRDSFEEKLAHALTDFTAGAVICADVNQFSAINSVYGYAVGDALLRSVGRRLRHVVPGSVPLGRIYGGRFATFLPAGDAIPARRLAAELVEAMHRAMVAPFDIAVGPQTITLSIGIATWPTDAGDADDLVGAAETAIHAIANEKRVRTRWFEPTMQVERRALLELGADLRQAIEQNQLSLHYQPKVCCSTREVVGFEALARWTHPTRGAILPSIFVPVAEQSSLIVELGSWVLREACRQQAAWRDAGFKLLPVAVNVSPQHMLSQSLGELLAPIEEYGLSLGCIEIEITETAMMDRLSSAQTVIDALRRSGLHISIDDFGTGHSSLGNLRRLPLDTLKIDRSFVEDIEDSQEAYDIVATIVAMAKALSLGVIAEGVETEAQAALLRAEGIEIMQGYLFARPLPGAEATRLLTPAGAPGVTSNDIFRNCIGRTGQSEANERD